MHLRLCKRPAVDRTVPLRVYAHHIPLRIPYIPRRDPMRRLADPVACRIVGEADRITRIAQAQDLTIDVPGDVCDLLLNIPRQLPDHIVGVVVG